MPPPRTALFEHIHGRTQAGVPFPEIVLSRVYTRTCFIAPSLGHISVTPVLVNQQRMPAVSLDLPPPLRAPRDSFSRGHTAHSFSRARVRGHGPWAGAQNRSSPRERPDARKLTRTQSCVHEPLRKSPPDRCWPLPISPSFSLLSSLLLPPPSLFLSPSLSVFSFSSLCHEARYLSPKDGVDISQWRKPRHNRSYRKKK